MKTPWMILTVLAALPAMAQNPVNLPWLCNATSMDGLAFSCTGTLLDSTPISTSTLNTPVIGQQVVLVPQSFSVGGLTSTLSIDGGITTSPLRRANKRHNGPGGTFASDALKRLDLDTGGVYTAYWTGTTWRTSTPPPTTTATNLISVGPLSAGQCAFAGNFIIANASTADSNVTVTPQGDAGDGVYVQARVSGTGVVTLKVCAVVATTPNAISYLIGVQ